MYGETDVMRKRATQLREQGIEIRRMADRLVARTEAVGWTGRAADALAIRIRDRASRLHDVAARHDAAAESLEAHLLEVERLKDAIDDAEHRARHLAEDGVPFSPPPPGHKDWLALDLPGL
ncbi:hypothetical protein [Nocardioides sp. HB32]|jgi:chromosome segregation ATPase